MYPLSEDVLLFPPENLAASLRATKARSIGVMTTRTDRPAGDTTVENTQRQTFTARELWRTAATLGLTAILLTATRGVALAQSREDRGIVGTWLVQVTLRNWQTGTALGPAFNSMVTSNADGTLTEAAPARPSHPVNGPRRTARGPGSACARAYRRGFSR